MMTKPYLNIVAPIGVIIVISYVPMFLSDDWIRRFTFEDQVYETLSAVLFFGTAVLYIFAYYRAGKYHRVTHSGLKRGSYLVLALFFLIFAGEEISWGQRILGTGDSDLIRSINNQGETNIHNLKWLDDDAEDISFPLSLINSGNLFVTFIFSIWLLIPLAADVFKPARDFFDTLMPIFAWQLFLLMIPNIGLFFGVKWFLRTFPSFYHYRIQTLDWTINEVLEHNTALILMIIAAHFVCVKLAPAKTTIPVVDHHL